MIALALSGGGSRAIAFHLGCLRALHDRGVLDQVSVVSAVSGGSVLAGMYAYSDESFDEFDYRVTHALSKGLHRAILKELFSPQLFARVLVTNSISRPIAVLARLAGRKPPFRRWASRSDALEAALRRELFNDRKLIDVARPSLDIVLNACELRTGTAFRFGNRRSGSWRTGEVKDNDITVAHAVACSAAYPMLLPAFDRRYQFVKDGQTTGRRVLLTDGGVYDNLGLSCVEPGRDSRYSLLTCSPDYIICCSAGYGQFTGERIPYSFASRSSAAFEAVFRKAQDAAFKRLHAHKEAGSLKGFVLAYLGQQDGALPNPPQDLVSRSEVYGYPTDFAAMPQKTIDRLSLRGEQLTRVLIQQYCQEL